MKFRILLALLCGATAFRATALDLTPRYIDTYRDGVTVRRLFFADGDQKIGLSINRETTVEEGGGGVVFRFPKFPDILFTLKHSPMSADQPFDGVALAQYQEAARHQLPPGSTDIKILPEEAEPITINRWHSHRFNFSCETGGFVRHVTVTFLNISADEQLLLVVSAKEENFKEAATRSWQIIRSWQPLLPGDELLPKGS
jgi:hypothetical protein